jgi:hypothetical protein
MSNVVRMKSGVALRFPPQSKADMIKLEALCK